MPSGSCVAPHQILADGTDRGVKKPCLLAEMFSEPILVCSAFTCEMKKFVLHTQDRLLQLMWGKMSIAGFYVKHVELGKI